MRTVLTYGTFDVLHAGHVRLLARAKALGDRLIVGLSTDDFNTLKHKSSLLDFNNRRIVLEAMRYVDLVFPEGNWDQKLADVRRYHVNVFVMGDDWEGKFDFLKSECEVVYLPRTENISSTLIRQELQDIGTQGL
ncbi:glycerol-3-phosphate cytidylyltransferase [Pseudomonas sp. Leaf127]|uniref:glycerol-3-phosphate cytidylyltransferase n=1 Tax=Pseudomonas sp. Leaf127 TaxID=1736267 RepID=UPI0007032F36|nr:glycerol-3-phosphate cytidylyltransferase [Pseudomonas sp. Leaf127]KQQ57116.1 glycerol-3-phosphate cytidylyltransferase [Pseudomonas sp. Leaf127]